MYLLRLINFENMVNNFVDKRKKINGSQILHVL